MVQKKERKTFRFDRLKNLYGVLMEPRACGINEKVVCCLYLQEYIMLTEISQNC